MKKLLFIILFPVFGYAEGPILKHDAILTQEFDNVYKDIRSKGLNGGTSGYALVGTGTDSKPGYNFNLLGNTSGQMLIGQGAAAMPIWTTFGRILQISTMSVITSTTNATSSFIRSGLQKELIRISTTSVVLVYATLSHMQNSTSGSSAQSTLFRDEVNLAPDGVALCETRSATAPDRFACSMMMVDYPPSTSGSVTYGVRFKTDGAGTAQIATGSASSQVLFLIEISR